LLFEKLFGQPPYKEEAVASEGVKTSFFSNGPNKIELLEATHPDSPIAKFIEKKGEGIHHIAFDVEDIVAEIARLQNEGFVVLNETPKPGADNKLVAFDDYSASDDAEADSESGSVLDRIAVVYAEGDIEDGEGLDGVVASRTVVEALRDIRKNKRIKAVVLRINSPGGSALASDVMWRELDLLRKEKPLVISMGNLAASGGYYIAAPGERIFAQPTTITGSIGVFGLFFTGEELLRNKVGIRFEGVGTHTYSNFGQLDRTLTDSERLLVQANVDQTYGRFLQVVSKGRGLDSSAVDSMAQGRVWSGTDALRLGLVDAHGGLMDALAYAQKKANLKGAPRISTYPQEQNALEALLTEFSKGSASLRQKAQWGPLAEVAVEWQRLERMKGVQMRMTEVGPL
jgi:protease-4